MSLPQVHLAGGFKCAEGVCAEDVFLPSVFLPSVKRACACQMRPAFWPSRTVPHPPSAPGDLRGQAARPSHTLCSHMRVSRTRTCACMWCVAAVHGGDGSVSGPDHAARCAALRCRHVARLQGGPCGRLGRTCHAMVLTRGAGGGSRDAGGDCRPARCAVCAVCCASYHRLQ